MAELTEDFGFSRITRKPDDEDEWDITTTSTSTSRSRNEYVPEDNPGDRELETNLQPLIGDLFASNLNRKLNRKCYHPEQSSPGLPSPAF